MTRSPVIMLFFSLLWGPRGNAAALSPKIPRDVRDIAIEDLDGHAIRPLIDQKGPATVLIFVTRDCPISNRYTPTINQLWQEFSRQQVKFHVVYVETEDKRLEIKKHAAAYEYKFAPLFDPRHTLVKAVRVAVTPEAFVFTPDGKIAYQGRIDDRFIDFGKMRHSPTRQDLRLALQSIVAGRPVAIRRTEAIGCFVSGSK